jgi:CBS domain-containing protein
VTERCTEFLKQNHPFTVLTADEMTHVCEAGEEEHAAAGATILRQGAATSAFLFLVAEGQMRLERDGAEIQILEQGDCFGYPSIISNSAPTSSVVAVTDALLYRIPADVFSGLLTQNPRFAEFFLQSLGDRLSLLNRGEAGSLGGELTTPLEDLPMRPVVRVAPGATVADAAVAMRDAREDVVLVTGHPAGIVTDHDFQTRVLAEGLGPDILVERIMTSPVLTLPGDTPVHSALLTMLEEGIHHLPVTEDGDILGIVSATDLLRHQSRNPLYLMRQLENLAGPEALAGYGANAAAMVERLFDGGLKVGQIGRIFSSLNDALIRRLIKLAEKELGPPPCPYAWLVFGSEGRMEQALLTDQDNALCYQEDIPGAKEYFANLAERVVNDLITAGFPPCPGGCMATNWNKSLQEWEETVEGWIRTPTPDNLMVSSIFFDFRAVAGSLSMEPIEKLIDSACDNQLFMAHLARVSLRFKPPLGLFRRIRTEDGQVDLKKRGIASVVAAARVYALEAGTRRRPTRERLEMAMAEGIVSGDVGQGLIETYRFLLQLRLQEQLDRIRAGEEPTNSINPARLSSLEQRHLKDAFQAIREMQSSVARRYRTESLG